MMQLVPVSAVSPKADVMHVSITTQGAFNILKSSLHQHLKNMFVQFYVNPSDKSIIAWTFHEKVPLDTVREFNKVSVSSTGQMTMCGRKPMVLCGKIGKSFKNIPVKILPDKSLLESKHYYYVELK